MYSTRARPPLRRLQRLRPPRPLAALLAALALGAGCRPADDALPSADSAAIADDIRRLVREAYDLERDTNVVARFAGLYPARGPVISATAGRLTTSRDSVEAGIRWFWENVGRHMVEPRWEWRAMHVDVLSPDAAVMTATYRVPHRTPEGAPHVIAGAWTALFVRRDGRWVIVQEHLSDVPAAAAR